MLKRYFLNFFMIIGLLTFLSAETALATKNKKKHKCYSSCEHSGRYYSRDLGYRESSYGGYYHQNMGGYQIQPIRWPGNCGSGCNSGGYGGYDYGGGYGGYGLEAGSWGYQGGNWAGYGYGNQYDSWMRHQMVSSLYYPPWGYGGYGGYDYGGGYGGYGGYDWSFGLDISFGTF